MAPTHPATTPQPREWAIVIGSQTATPPLYEECFNNFKENYKLTVGNQAFRRDPDTKAFDQAVSIEALIALFNGLRCTDGKKPSRQLHFISAVLNDRRLPRYSKVGFATLDKPRPDIIDLRADHLFAHNLATKRRAALHPPQPTDPSALPLFRQWMQRMIPDELSREMFLDWLSLHARDSDTLLDVMPAFVGKTEPMLLQSFLYGLFQRPVVRLATGAEIEDPIKPNVVDFRWLLSAARKGPVPDDHKNVWPIRSDAGYDSDIAFQHTTGAVLFKDEAMRAIFEWLATREVKAAFPEVGRS